MLYHIDQEGVISVVCDGAEHTIDKTSHIYEDLIYCLEVGMMSSVPNLVKKHYEAPPPAIPSTNNWTREEAVNMINHLDKDITAGEKIDPLALTDEELAEELELRGYTEHGKPVVGQRLDTGNGLN